MRHALLVVLMCAVVAMAAMVMNLQKSDPPGVPAPLSRDLVQPNSVNLEACDLTTPLRTPIDSTETDALHLDYAMIVCDAEAPYRMQPGHWRQDNAITGRARSGCSMLQASTGVFCRYT